MVDRHADELLSGRGQRPVPGEAVCCDLGALAASPTLADGVWLAHGPWQCASGRRSEHRTFTDAAHAVHEIYPLRSPEMAAAGAIMRRYGAHGGAVLDAGDVAGEGTASES
jgi:hypothetical protein